MGIKAVVRGGFLELRTPTELPEGTELELVIDDESGLTAPDDLEALNAALIRAANQLEQGRWVDGQQLLERLKAKGE